MLPTSTKSGSNLSITFPDVCKNPAPPAGSTTTPLPYPNIAKSAIAKAQQKTNPGVKQPVAASAFSATQGNQAGTLKGMVAVGGRPNVIVSGEIQGLKGLLGTLNVKLQNMTSKDPNEWQIVLQEYAVAASALYVTLHDDD